MFESIHSRIDGRDAHSVADSLETLIRDGRLLPGARVPTVRGLAKGLGLSPTTVAAAYRMLRLRGVLKGEGRNGTFVSARPPVSQPRPDLVVPEGLQDLAAGNPDPHFLPSLRPALGALDAKPRLYGTPPDHPELVRLALRSLAADDLPKGDLAIVGGAMDGVERVLQARLRPGDPVAVEDPGYTAVFDLLGALGLAPEPVPVDDAGMLPHQLEATLKRGVRACIVTPRAQNPTGAALDTARARALRALWRAHPKVFVVEDDHAGPVAGAPAFTTIPDGHPAFAIVRSVSKWLGPDLRVAFLQGDAATVARVQGRQSLGSGWVSHVLQELVARLWSSRDTMARLRRAEAAYAERRSSLLHALRDRQIQATGRSGFNVWIGVPEEAAVVAALGARGWAVRAGERYRLASAPAIRVTAASLTPTDAARFASDLAAILRPARRTSMA
ncbi:MAG TPA: aminotransferase class I/II-fold pyridoxal phosphate-dependent enzyme [Vicinamibacteria bacterium]|nr:aminotransferase class I/II-fold pyridoxal phosphate-dependent enzyme [Vicinamibacteria bacterium]